MRHSQTYTQHSRSLLRVTASFAALFLVFFGAANGLASQELVQHTIYRYTGATRVGVRAWYIKHSGQPSPSIYESFPFLQNMQHQGGSQGGTLYWPYGYSISSSSAADYTPYYYYDIGDYYTTVIPDAVTDDMIQSANDYYKSLPLNQQIAISGLLIGQVTKADGTTDLFTYFRHRNNGTVYNDGVVTYDSEGVPVVSYPDSNGYISGYTPNPDGSYNPVYYTIQNGSAVEVSSIPTPTYDSLQYDTDTGHYSLSVPDYSPQLDTIISKLDKPSNPSINPDITVNVTGSDLSDIEASLVQIGNTLVADDVPIPNLSTNDLSLTQDEQTAVSSLRDWETNIPLIGDTIDFGLTTLLGRIPAIGTEYVWMDHTVGSNTRSSFLPSFRIFISLENYRQVILALRGFLILFEALLFLVMTYRNIREALKV